MLFDSLWFSGGDPSWAARRFRQGSSKGAPQFHQGSSIKVPRKVPPRLRRGSTKISPRSRKFRDLSGLLGQIRFWGGKRFCGRFPHHFFKLVSRFLNSFLHFSSTALAFGSSALVKVLVQNGTSVFLGSLQQMAFASQKVLWRVPSTILYICLPNGCCFIKFFGGFRQYIYLPVSSWGQSCMTCWHASPIQIQSAENKPSCRCCWGILWSF